MKKCLIIGGGPVDPAQLGKELELNPDLVIAADRGGEYLVKAGRFPEVLVGDCDSLAVPFLKDIKTAGVEIHRFPAAKDQTDLELALDLALERGCMTVRIMGGLGARLDHTLGNVGLLAKALQQGVPATLVDPNHTVTVINREIVLSATPGWAVSLIPLTPVVIGVTTAGLSFPLINENLSIYNTRGLHNEFRATQAVIRIREGLLIVVLFREE